MISDHQTVRPEKVSTLKTIYSTATIGICSFTFGTNLSILNGFKDVFMGNKKKGIPGMFKMSDMHWSHATSILCIGALLSNIGITSIPLKRKHLMILNNLMYIAGQLLILFAKSIHQVIIGRLIIGIASGITCAIVPLYFQKLSPGHMKGIYGSLHQLSLCAGIFAAQLFSFYFCRTSNWKVGMWIIIGYLALHLLMLCFVVEIEDRKMEETSSVISLFMNQRSRNSILTSILLHSGQQFSGIRAVIFYSSKIFEGKNNPNLYSGLVGLTLVLGTFVSMFVVDNIGRKRMLTFSILSVIMSLGLLSFKIQDFLGIFGFIMGYSMGLGPIPWFITGEVFPERYKKPGNLVSVSANWVATYLVAISFNTVFSKLDSLIFTVFAGISSVLLIYILIFFTETKGRKADFI